MFKTIIRSKWKRDNSYNLILRCRSNEPSKQSSFSIWLHLLCKVQWNLNIPANLATLYQNEPFCFSNLSDKCHRSELVKCGQMEIVLKAFVIINIHLIKTKNFAIQMMFCQIHGDSTFESNERNKLQMWKEKTNNIKIK